jgi:hypothetical protein
MPPIVWYTLDLGYFLGGGDYITMQIVNIQTLNFFFVLTNTNLKI